MRAAILIRLAALFATAPAEDAAFDALLRDARAALAKKDLDQARVLAKQAIEASGEPGDAPDAAAKLAKAFALEGDVELEAKKHRAAVDAYKKAAQVAPDEATRRNLIAKRRRAANDGKMEKDVERADELAKHDAFVSATERQAAVGAQRRAEVREKIGEAIAVYRADKDPERVRWAEAVRAAVSAKSGAPEEGCAEAQAIIAEKQSTPRTREVALDAIMKCASGTEAVARAALALNQLRAAKLPEAKRRWSRMRGLDQLCDKLDGETRAGACARLERQVTGTYTFTDQSKERPKKELGDREVARTHAQLLPAIEDCVLSAAKATPERYDNSDVDISWAIQPNGAVTDLAIAPKRYKDELEPCVKERLGWARYPKYTSVERKTVAVPFHLGR